MKLIALKPMRYGTRRLLPGDDFEATPAHGRLLVAIRKAADPLKREVGRVAAPKASVLQKAAEATKQEGTEPDTTQPPAPAAAEGATTPATLHPAGETIDTLRAEYLALVGKKPFNGWDIETLQAKIAQARAG